MTSLNTELTNKGILITDKHGAKQFLVEYAPTQVKKWYLLDADDNEVSRHNTSEAAQYRALSEYLDSI